MNATIFLLSNLALSFYLVGAIWAHEIDIFRSWKLIGVTDFPIVQSVHWSKLPYWIFTPLGLALAGSIALIWYHPQASPGWAIWGSLACQLAKILATHWIRTLLINGYALILLAWAIYVLA